jgi:hypothetical protein
MSEAHGARTRRFGGLVPEPVGLVVRLAVRARAPLRGWPDAIAVYDLDGGCYGAIIECSV